VNYLNKYETRGNKYNIKNYSNRNLVTNLQTYGHLLIIKMTLISQCRSHDRIFSFYLTKKLWCDTCTWFCGRFDWQPRVVWQGILLNLVTMLGSQLYVDLSVLCCIKLLSDLYQNFIIFFLTVKAKFGPCVHFLSVVSWSLS